MLEHVFWPSEYRQGTLFAAGPPAIDETFAALDHTELDGESWVDLARGWMSGADEVFDALVEQREWHQRIVTMYERTLPEPRLTSWWRESSGDGEPLPVLDQARRVLSDRFGCAFDSIGYNWYRTGEDSVAWHGDRFAQDVRNPTIAIVSVGEPRSFRLRPHPRRGLGGRSRSFDIGHGDLLVMGGACQHDWQHSVPKVHRSIGPRISITFRHDADYRPRRVVDSPASPENAQIRDLR